MAARRFPLRPPWGMLIVGIVFFGGATAVFVHLMSTSDRGLIIYGWELDAHDARTAYGLFATAAGTFVATCLVAMVRLARGLAIVADDDAITIARVMKAPATIPYAKIRDAYIVVVQGHELLTVVGPEGNASIARGYVSEADYVELIELLSAKVPQHRIMQIERRAPRRERRLAKSPLPGPPQIDADPFRSPPAAQVRPIETAAPPAAAPVVADADAPAPKLLR